MYPTSTLPSLSVSSARHSQRAVAVMLGLFSSLISLGLAALALGFLGSIGFAASSVTSLPITSDAMMPHLEFVPSD
jgi:hypothetical protein